MWTTNLHRKPWQNEWNPYSPKDETGFIKGGYISGENIRLFCDLLEQKNIYQSSGILLQIDFRKAFDTL